MPGIPKIIHYCWVGGKPKPQSVLYCIESWKRCCPDYEIREWNENNYDFTQNEYMRQAYEAKKWGFVPDYARLDILWRWGGIYLDTDVEAVRSFDALLENECFFGFEETGTGEYYVNCGHGFGAVPGHSAVLALRDHYRHLRFAHADGSLNLLPSPSYTTQCLEQLGLVRQNRDQRLPGVQVYASDVLCPKNYTTGQVTKTQRTVSVHHFSASWVDAQIREEAAHQHRIKSRWGDRLGGYILLGESVLEKYTPAELVTRLPVRLAGKAKVKCAEALAFARDYGALLRISGARTGSGGTVLLDTALESDNMGDAIIMENCLEQLPGCLKAESLPRVPTHRLPTEPERQLLENASCKLLCGTNILSGHMRSYGLWRMDFRSACCRNTLLMGVGFDSEAEHFDGYTKRLFHTILTKQGLHSVRDSFSEQMLRSMGIENVLNTGCPTMWQLIPAHCAAIPREKARRVICTVTDYCRDPHNDGAMLRILLERYETVYVWLQGSRDREYLRELGLEDRVVPVPSDLASYDRVLEQEDLDYVGTRLHAGIRALRRGRRCLVVAIDNRAKCISADTGLPVIVREEIPVALERRVEASFETKLTMPWENIARWKEQFET